MSTAVTASSQPRLYYLDWIRVISIICIFFFHNARFYDVFSDWHVKNATTNTAASILVALFSLWIMPLFFLIAGAGTYLALRFRNVGQFAGERCLRLLIPLLFGMLVVVVPQAYFEALGNGVPLTGYNVFQIYILYLQTLPEVNTFHLWFLLYLFVFSIILLPLFFSPKGADGSLISRLVGAVNSPRAHLALFILSIGIADAFLYPEGFWGDRGRGGWNILTYVLFFTFGYLIFANGKIMETVKKLRWVTLSAALISSIVLVVFFLDVFVSLTDYYGTPAFIVAQFLRSLACWGWLFAILGLSSRFLNFQNRFLAYANEAVLPFYILHQTIIISIGFYVTQWTAGVGLKYLVISTASLAAIMLLYEIVKRTNILRFFFGMHLLRAKSKAKSALAPAA